MKIYVASSWRNNTQPEVVQALRAVGHEVYDFKNPPNRTGFAWSEIDTNWLKWTANDFIKALEHKAAKDGFASDFNAMVWADVCVLVLPSGRSAHSEAGWFAGSNKPVIVLTDDYQEPELMYKMFHYITTTITGVIKSLENIEK